MRATKKMQPCLLRVGNLLEKKLRFTVPAEMINLKIKPDILDKFRGDHLTIDLIPLGEDGKPEKEA